MSVEASGSTAPAPVWIQCTNPDCPDPEMTVTPETAERGGVIKCPVCGIDFPLREARVIGR